MAIDEEPSTSSLTNNQTVPSHDHRKSSTKYLEGEIYTIAVINKEAE